MPTFCRFYGLKYIGHAVTLTYGCLLLGHCYLYQDVVVGRNVQISSSVVINHISQSLALVVGVLNRHLSRP
ncbi:MAG: hypothetical protein II322_03430 [Alistipes sp.]|nr:hypothetical protein [Alistipes sp.]